MARRLCQFILEIFSFHTISSSFLYFTCDLLFGVVPVFLWYIIRAAPAAVRPGP